MLFAHQQDERPGRADIYRFEDGGGDEGIRQGMGGRDGVIAGVGVG